MNSRDVGWEEVELEESEIINRRFREMIRHKDSESESRGREHKFTSEEAGLIAQRFQELCGGGRMNYEQFRRGLGLLGREDSFICRIFNLIDEDGDGLITQQNYLEYLSVILRGSDLQKSRFGWLILTEKKGDLQLGDFLELFQEISVVWNALTGEIITPKRRYIEELFNTFDVDQDQAITFHDYRLFFNEHLLLFGWFEYFNNIDVDEEFSRSQLDKVRQKLRSKLQLEPREGRGQDMEELKLLVADSELQIEKKLLYLTRNLQESSNYIRRKNGEIKAAAKEQEIGKSNSQSSLSATHVSSGKLSATGLSTGQASGTLQSSKTTLGLDDSVSLKSLYKYNCEESIRSTPLNKIQIRRQKFKKESKNGFNLQVAKELKGFLESSYKLMQLCHAHRTFQQRQKKFSPTKLKQMQVKLNLFDRQVQPDSPAQKQKMTVYFGHENWNLVLNIMVGLRKSIKALYELNTHLQIKDHHYTEQHEFFLGNKSFLSGKGPEALKNMENFQFIEMAPTVFERLRSCYGISNNDYQRSVGPQSLLNQLLTGDLTALNEKCSTGKSGAFFYLTSDNRVFLKTIPKRQFLFFLKVLRNYYEHMTEHANTMVVRTYGLYKLKVFVNKQKVNTIYFISMENIFHSVRREEGLEIKEVYDLKGSLYGRTGEDGKELKDMDWIDRKKKIRLPAEVAEVFREQIKIDSRFFKKNNINDYSLMVAFVKHSSTDPPSQEGSLFKSFKGGCLSKDPGCYYILSIIDILTVFETRKNFEYIFKSTFLSKDVSCIPPSDYCARFREFVLASVD